MMQIRSLIVFALICASVSAAPVHAQQESVAAPRFESPAGLGLQMVESLRAAGLAQPTGRLVLFVDSGGVQPRVSFQLSNVPDSLYRVVLPLVHEYVTARTFTSAIHLSILLEGMARPSPRDAGAVTSEQLPEMANGTQISTYLTNVAQTHPASVDGTIEVRAMVKVYVAETGQVVVVEAQPTGDAHIDPYLITIGHAMRFRPARINRRPVGVWIVIPLHFSPSR